MKTKAFQARQVFNKKFKGKNFMTPDVISYGKSGRYFYELSTGNDFDHNDIFGVTVVNIDTNEHDHEKSQMFYDRNEAKDYIKSL